MDWKVGTLEVKGEEHISLAVFKGRMVYVSHTVPRKGTRVFYLAEMSKGSGPVTFGD